MDPTQGDLIFLNQRFATMKCEEVWTALLHEFKAAHPQQAHGTRVDVEAFAVTALAALQAEF